MSDDDPAAEKTTTQGDTRVGMKDIPTIDVKRQKSRHP